FATEGKFQGIAFHISLGLHFPHLAQARVRTYDVARERSIGINRAKNSDSAISYVDRTERGFRRYLALHPNTVLQSVRNTGARVERGDAGRDTIQVARLHRIVRGRVDKKPKQVNAVEVQQVTDRAGPGPVIENSGSSTNDGLALGAWCISEADARSKVVGIVMKIILPVIAHADINRKIWFQPDVVFEEAAEYLLQKRDMPLPRLDE